MKALEIVSSGTNLIQQHYQKKISIYSFAISIIMAIGAIMCHFLGLNSGFVTFFVTNTITAAISCLAAFLIPLILRMYRDFRSTEKSPDVADANGNLPDLELKTFHEQDPMASCDYQIQGANLKQAQMAQNVQKINNALNGTNVEQQIIDCAQSFYDVVGLDYDLSDMSYRAINLLFKEAYKQNPLALQNVLEENCNTEGHFITACCHTLEETMDIYLLFLKLDRPPTITAGLFITILFLECLSRQKKEQNAADVTDVIRTIVVNEGSLSVSLFTPISRILEDEIAENGDELATTVAVVVITLEKVLTLIPAWSDQSAQFDMNLLKYVKNAKNDIIFTIYALRTINWETVKALDEFQNADAAFKYIINKIDINLVSLALLLLESTSTEKFLDALGRQSLFKGESLTEQQNRKLAYIFRSMDNATAIKYFPLCGVALVDDDEIIACIDENIVDETDALGTGGTNTLKLDTDSTNPFDTDSFLPEFVLSDNRDLFDGFRDDSLITI